jgi:hypothetical protein
VGYTPAVLSCLNYFTNVSIAIGVGSSVRNRDGQQQTIHQTSHRNKHQYEDVSVIRVRHQP